MIEEMIGRPGLEHGLALGGEVGRRDVARLARDLGSPPAQEGAHGASASASRLGGGSGIQRLSWKPPLLPARTSAAQALMAVGLHQERAAAAEPAGIGNGDGQRGGAGARHRREQDGDTKAVGGAEGLGAGKQRIGGRHDRNVTGSTRPSITL